VLFDWDREKASDNERKHGVTFVEAMQVFDDEHSSCVPDPDHSMAEERFLIFGISKQGRHLVVSYTERGLWIRLISARQMTPHERRAYEQ
jgi:uncharacterized protein